MACSREYNCTENEKTELISYFVFTANRPQGYKTFFFMLNSAEREIFPAHKC